MINQNLINRNFNNIAAYPTQKATQSSSNSTSFQDILKSQANSDDEIQFSKHASMRIFSRNLNLDESQMARIKAGISKASEKGIKDSLVLIDDIALVVNVKSKTIITAIENETDKVYSNIDGAVIV